MLTFCVSLFRYALEGRGLTRRRSVNAALGPQSCMTGSTWASWLCYHWYCTGFSLSGTLGRKGRAVDASKQPFPSSKCVIRDLLICWFSSSALLQHVTAMLECSMSVVITLLVTEPVGVFSIRSCSVQMLSDWYTMLYNPSPDYINTLHCTQEAVYPL